MINMGTHRLSPEVEKRLGKWVTEKYRNMDYPLGLTINDIVGLLLTELGF